MLGGTIRTITNVLLVLFCVVINMFITEIKYTKNCPISKWSQVNNGIALVNLLFITTLINYFVPIHNFLYHIPIIGGWYILLFGLWIFIILYIITSLSQQIRENEYKNCINEKTKMIYNTFKTHNIITNLLTSIFITIIYFFVLQKN